MNISRVKTPLAVISVAWMLTACGSDGTQKAVAIDDLLGQVESAECALGVRCGLFSDGAFCKAWFEQVTSTGGLSAFDANVAAVKAGRSKYDPAAAGPCLKALSESPCVELTTGLGAASAVCQKVFTGTIADGQSCAVDVECRSGSFCALAVGSTTTAGCVGTCTHGGTLCNDDSHCTGGQVCDDTRVSDPTARGTCITPTPPGAVDEPCGTRRGCQAGLVCSAFPLGTSSSTCKTSVKMGEACGPSECIDGLICMTSADGSRATCEKPVAKGEPCELPRQCGGQLTSIVCDLAQHRCVDAPTSGPCGAPTLTPCNILTSFCDFSAPNPVCKPIAAIGAPCRVASGECGITGATCEETAPGSSTGICTIRTTCDP